MRICIVSQEYPPISDYWGGIGTQYGRLAPELARAGHEVRVITRAPAERSGTHEGVAVDALPRGRFWPWHVMSWARRIAERLRETGPYDAILTPEFSGECSAYAARQDAGPLVTHLLTSLAQLHAIRPGLTFLERSGPRARASLVVERRQTRQSRALLGPGTAVVDWARELWPEIRSMPTEILPLSIDVDEVRRAAASGSVPDAFPGDAGGPIVCFASRMDGHKGTQHLVEAMHSVWASHPEARLVFVGRDTSFGHGTMSDHLRSLAGERVGQVSILGYQDPEPYFATIAASDFVSIPSLWESFCLAAVEAMALGKPVVATTGHGFSEFIRDGENGLLVGRGNVPELAGALERLVADPELRARLGAAASATAERHRASELAPAYADVLARLVTAR